MLMEEMNKIDAPTDTDVLVAEGAVITVGVAILIIVGISLC